MNHESKSLPNDLEFLKDLVIQQRDQISQLQTAISTQNAKLDHQSNTIDQLIEAIALARQQYFGSRGQKVDTESAQLSWLFNEAEAIADHESNTSDQDNDDPGSGKKQTAPRKRRSGGRKPLPDHFPRIEIIHTLDEADCYCDHCQGQLKEMLEEIHSQAFVPVFGAILVDSLWYLAC